MINWSVRVGKSQHQRKPQALNSTVTTTSPFTWCQPIYMQECVANSHISLSTRQIVTCNAMPLPTFGKVNMNIYSWFVPTAKLWHPYEFLRKQQEFGTSNPYIPTSTPKLTISALSVWFMLNYSGIAFYKRVSSTSTEYDIVSSESAWNTVNASFVTAYSNAVTNMQNTANKLYAAGQEGFPTIGSADYILGFTHESTQYYAAVHLTDEGRRVRTALQGLRFYPNTTLSDTINILPFFGYYRCYWTQMLQIYDYSWEKTNAHKLLYTIENGNLILCNQSFLSVDGPQNTLWKGFVDDIVNAYYTYPQDFVGSHLSTPSLSPSLSTSSNVPSGLSTSVGNNRVGMQSDNALPALSRVSDLATNVITSDRLTLLQRLSTIVNKNTVLGGRIDKWLKAMLGAEYQNDDSPYCLGTFQLGCDFEEIMNTAETSEAKLGEFAGRGRSWNFQDKPFNFETKADGYLFVFMCLVPEGNFCEGLNPAFLHSSWDTFYNPELDGLGYEISPKSLILGGREVTNSPNAAPSASFGFIPRMSSFKFSFNNVNGDISRRAYRASLLAYNLDPYIEQDKVTITPNETNPTRFGIQIQSSNIPIADPAWRFRGRYEWMSNFNRIFYNGNLQTVAKDVPWSFPTKYDTYYVVDNFNVNIHVKCTVNAPMLPSGNSFDTDSFDSYAIEVSKA